MDHGGKWGLGVKKSGGYFTSKCPNGELERGIGQMKIPVGACCAIALVGLSVGSACADVRLELRPTSPVAFVGETVEFGLYAHTDSLDGSEAISAMDVVLVWNPGLLEFVEIVNNGPYSWLWSVFPEDSGLDGLNDSLEDGDAFYTALSRFGDSAVVTSDGLLVTTLVFRMLTPSAAATVSPVSDLGVYSTTSVYSAEPGHAGELITGALQSGTVIVLSDVEPGKDLFDVASFQECFSGEMSSTDQACLDTFDYNNDQRVDRIDFFALHLLLDGPGS